MKWTREETGRSFNPYYYRTEYKGMVLSLAVPYESDPWRVRLTDQNKCTVHKDVFRLRHNDRAEDKNLWESADDLEKAEEKAFEIMENYIAAHLRYWERVRGQLIEMKNLKGSGQEGIHG